MSKRAQRKRARQHEAMDGAAVLCSPPTATTTASSTVSPPSIPVESDASTAPRKRRVIPLVHSQRLRKHAALIHAPTPGLLLCCNRNRETEVMLDTLSLVRLYADRLYGTHSAPEAEAEGEGEEEDDGSRSRLPQPPPAMGAGGGEGVADSPSAAAPLRRRGRFSLASVGGVEGLAFIAFNDVTAHPDAIVNELMRDLSDDCLPLPLSPHLYRILPIQHTASAASVSTLMPPPSCPLLASTVPSPSFTFSVVFRHSNCSSVERGDAIRALAGRVEEEAQGRGLQATVKLVGGDVAVLCWLVKSVAFIGVVQGYDQCHQLNVVELQKAAKAKAMSTTAAAAAVEHDTSTAAEG